MARKPFNKKRLWRYIIGGLGIIFAVVVAIVIISSGGIIEAYEDIVYGDDGGILLYTSLDDEDSILYPEPGSGGQFSLLSSDFLPGMEDNGILFVRGGYDCELADIQEVSFPAWDGDELNVDMEDGELTFWYQPQYDAVETSGNYYLFAVTADGGTPPYISLEFYEGSLTLLIEDEEENWYETYSETREPLWSSGDWVYIRAVWDAYEDEDSLQLFVDDVRVDPFRVPGGWRIDAEGTDIRVYIGSNSPCGGSAANGIIDDLTIHHFP